MKTEYDGNPYKFRFNVRPVRGAYFFLENDSESLKKILQLLGTQWGGIGNLVIPLSDSLEIDLFYQDLLVLYDPDLFVAYLGNEIQEQETNKKALQKEIQSILPDRRVSLHAGSFIERYDSTAHAVGMIPDDVLNENKVKMPEIKINNEIEDLINLATFGSIFPGQEELYDPIIVRERLDLGSEPFWLNQLETDPFSSTINLTTYNTSAIRVTGGELSYGGIRIDDQYDIVFVDSPRDICLFWNIRSIRETQQFKHGENLDRRTICFPSSVIDNPISVENLLYILKQHLFFPGRTANLDLRLYTQEPQIHDKIEKLFEESLKIESFRENKIVGNTLHFGSGGEKNLTIIDRPLNYIFTNQVSIPEELLEGMHGSKSTQVYLQYGDNEIAIESPSGFVNRFGGDVMLDLECAVWQRYPSSPKIAEQIVSKSRFTRYGLSMMLKGLRPHFRKISLPSEHQAMIMGIQKKGYSIAPTKIDQFSNSVIELVGGIDKLALLATPNTFALLNAIATNNSLKTAQKIIKELEKRGAKLEENAEDDIVSALNELGIVPELDVKPRNIEQFLSDETIRGDAGKKELLELVEGLSSLKVLQRGYYIECPNCGKESWHGLEDIAEVVTCQGCFFSFSLPVREPSNPREEIRWRYRLNSLVNRALDQDVLVGCFALYVLSRSMPVYSHAFGLGVTKDGEQITDFDFVLLSNQKVIIGECKSGSMLVEKDFDNARLATELGCSKYYFCTLSEFDNETKANIEELTTEFKDSGVSTKIYILERDHLFGIKDLDSEEEE